MRKEIVLIFVLMFAFACSAIAETLPDEAFFLNCIDARITKCERKAALLKSTGKNTKAAGEKAKRESEFLTNHRLRLAGDMIAKGVPAKTYKADHYLIKAYSEGTANLAGK
ncbi:MAG: hypothetical protein LLG06_13080 [Desulfobacteraceae bacterium]|nr:hypothetical protein [Desulfobacteraceae bacterium]